jgi:hypothetical protein
MGIRTLLVPFAYIVAVVLNKLKISIYAIVTFSFLVIFAAAAAFYMAFESALNSELFKTLAVAGVFLTGFTDEVIRELSRTKKQPTFPLAIAKHSDMLLVFGILYVFMLDPYGIIPSLTLGEGAYIAIGVLMLFGVLIADFVAKRIEKRDPGIETRAERMFLLTGFMFLGFYFRAFALAILAGIAAITLSLYAWVILKKFDFYAAGEALYAGLLKLKRRISAGGLPDIQKPKITARSGAAAEEDFREYGAAEYSASGYNFTSVVNDRRSEPVSNVKVTLFNVETGESYTGYTDPKGRASFVGASEGQYSITLECEGFKDAEYERYISMDSGEVFVLKRPFTDLSIVITDRKKTMPIPSAEVAIRQPGSDQPALKKRADNLGVAYFDELDVRIWEICVSAAGYRDWKREINLEEENVVSVTLELTEPGAGPVETEPAAPKPKPQEEEQVREEEPEAPPEEADLPDIISDSTIFEYSSPGDVGPIVSLIVEEYRKHDMDVYLVSTPERAAEYSDLEVKIVDVPKEPEKFKDVLEEMPAGSVLIFEPLSNLIITGGFAAAFKFVKKTLAYMKNEGLTLACFLNPQAHDEKDVEKLRKILSSVKIEGDKIFR